ncbi:MAG: hypothetical protein HY825_02005 [Acidobacteria bacterium]|nr:hypothetical protein [Acidobacteriota bacterium]
METVMDDSEPKVTGDAFDVDSHLRRVLKPGPEAAVDLVARALEARRPRRRSTAFAAVVALVIVALALLARDARRGRQAPPKLTAVTVGAVVVTTTPSGGHWIVDRHGGTRNPTGTHLVVRGEGAR